MRIPSRSIVAGLGPILLACAANPAVVHSPRVQVTRTGNVTAVELDDFTGLAVEQETLVWCWAACAEMVLRFHGVETTQRRIAERIQGHGEDGSLKVEMACRHEILHALVPEMPRTEFELVWAGMREQLEELRRLPDVECDASSLVTIAIDRIAPPRSVPIDELRAGEPAIVGLRDPGAESGHAHVLYGATYEEPGPLARCVRRFADLVRSGEDADAAEASLRELVGGDVIERFAPGYLVHEVRLIDPEDGRPVALSMEEFAARVDFVLTRSDARRVLESFERIVRLEEER